MCEGGGGGVRWLTEDGESVRGKGDGRGKDGLHKKQELTCDQSLGASCLYCSIPLPPPRTAPFVDTVCSPEVAAETPLQLSCVSTTLHHAESHRVC